MNIKETEVPIYDNVIIIIIKLIIKNLRTYYVINPNKIDYKYSIGMKNKEIID